MNKVSVKKMLAGLGLGLTLLAPASAQNFPFSFPGSSRGGIGIGDVISIVGSRNGNVPVIGNQRNNRTSDLINLAGIVYQATRQGRQQQQVPVAQPNNYPPVTFPSLPQSNGDYPDSYRFPNSPSQSQSSHRAPEGYDYIENQGRPIRLDPRALPFTINAGGGQGDQIAAQAIEAWNQAGLGQVFVLTNQNADLNLDWSGSKVGSGARAETRMQKSSMAVVPTDLSVNISGRSQEELSRILTHELGHVLGLDHSQDPGDMMYPSEQRGSVSLSQRDLAMLQWLYSQNDFSPVIGRTDDFSKPDYRNQASQQESDSVCRH